VIRVLVVDAEPWSRAALASALRHAGFTTREVGDRAAAERAVEEFRPDLVLLDPSLADGAGLELARELGARRRTPVLIVTRAQTVEDRVAGLEVADDYILKPADPAEVVARARAIVRRTRGAFGALRFADVALDEATHEVVRAGRPIALTPTEFELLRFFLLNPRRVVSKLEIHDAVWEESSGDDVSTVETYVSYLRRKLDRLGPPLIQTVRLVGYVLREPDRKDVPTDASELG
jgi:two-component system OmpR family response regulator